MRLGVLLNQPGVFYNNEYFVKYTNLVDFFVSFSSDDRISQLVMCLPLSTKPLDDVKCPIQGYDQRKMSILRIPYYMGAFDLGKKLYKIFPMSVFQAFKLARDCDIIGSTMPSVAGLVFCSVAKLYNRKLFLIIRGDKIKGSAFFTGEKKYVYWLTIQIINELIKKIFKNDLVVVMGHDLARYYSKSCKNIHVIGAQIPDELFSMPLVDRFPKSEKHIQVLYVGRLSKEKNVGLLIEAFAKLAERYDVLLRIVGSGTEDSHLKKIVEKHGLEERVLFAGQIPHGERLFEEYQKADLFILPSLTEGIPRAILEAMCLRVPVISTKVGGIPTIVKHMDTGVLIDPNDVEDLVQSMILLIGNHTLRKKIVNNAFELSKEYSFSSLREKLLHRIMTL